MNVGTLTISLTARTASLAKAAAGVKAFESGIVASVQRINASISSVGMAFSALTIPIAAVSIGATKMFSDFEYGLHRISGLIGKSEDQVKQWGKEILGLAPKLGASAQSMTESLYSIVTSDPYRDSAINMELLEKATKAGEAGLGDIDGIARTAAYAMNAFGTANLSVSEAIDTVIFGVKEGVVTSEEYASALGKVLPAAQKVGMEFHEVAAATAAITRTGNNASEAITQIRRMLFTLIQAPAIGSKALAQMGTSYSQLISNIKNKGFLSVLQEIKNMSELKGEDFLADVFPNIRALLPVIDLLGENFEANVGIFERANTEIGGQLEKLWDSYTKTMRFALKQIFSEAGVTAIEFGNQIKNVVIPVLTSLVKMLSSAAKWFIGLDQEVKENVSKILLLAGALGPLLILFSSLISIIINVLKFGLMPLRLAFTVLKTAVLLIISPLVTFKKLLASITTIANANPITLITIAVFALNTAIWALVQSWDNTWAHIAIGWNKMLKFFLQIVVWFENLEWSKIWGGLKQSFNDAIQWIVDWWNNANAVVEQKLEDFRTWFYNIDWSNVWDGFKEAFTDILSWLDGFLVDLDNKIQPVFTKLSESKPFRNILSNMGIMGVAIDIPEPILNSTKTKEDLGLSKTENAIAKIDKANSMFKKTIEESEGFGAAFNRNAKKQVEPIFDWITKQWDSMWSKMEPPEFSVPSGSFGPTSAPVVETLDEFMKRMTSMEESINDYIYDPLLEVDQIIQDAQAELVTFTKRGFESGNSVRIIELRMQALQKVIDELSKQDILNVNQLKALQDFKIELNMETMRKSLSIMNSDMQMLNEQSKYLAGAWDENGVKLSILQTNLRNLLNIDIQGWTEENKQHWGDMVDDMLNRIRELEEIEEMQKMIASGFVNMTEALGTALIDAESGFKAFRDSMLNMIQSIINKLLEQAFFAMIANGSTQGLPGLIMAAVGIAAIKAMASKASSDANSAAKMAGGGVVPGGYPNDTYPALLTSGETVVPPGKLPDFEKSFNKGQTKFKMDGEWKIKGKDLWYIVKEQQRLIGNAY